MADRDPEGDGWLTDDAQLFDMEPFALDKLTLLAGDRSRLHEPGGRYAAAVHSADDYGMSCEGLLYGLGAVGSMFWFFTYRLTVTPILLLCPLFALRCCVPLCVYRVAARRTIVERLRETE